MSRVKNLSPRLILPQISNSCFHSVMANYFDLTGQDRSYLKQCVALAQESLHAGDEPFGSILVSAENEVLFTDRNRVSDGDHTRHPEFEIARWAAEHLTDEQRANAVVYTSGEHCPMCAAAHAWVGLGRIVYASSSEQLRAWHQQWGIPASPVASLPINAVAPEVEVIGPDSDLAEQIRRLHLTFHGMPQH